MSEIESSLRKERIPFGYRRYEHVDESPGLYSFWARDTCLYVGMSMNLRNRLEQHCINESNPELKEFFETYNTEITFSVECVDVSEKELQRIEAVTIRAMQPLTNRIGKT